jgi:LacI family transcriptional regulator
MTIPKVALLIETSRGFGRDLLRGIVRYARLHGPWGFYITPGDFEQALPRMRQWGGTGIIARIETPRVAAAILAAGLPTVALDLSEEQLRAGHPFSRFSEVASDSHRAAQMAAEHLLDRKLRHFAFVGIPDRVWSNRRETGFCRRIDGAGFSTHVYRAAARSRDRTWECEQPILARWLAALPRPVGVMACNDDRGREVLEACRAAGVRVPEEVAVVGVDNDELLCELAYVPLSSVAMNAERGGYEAAQLLDKLMRGRLRKPQRLVVDPVHVVARRSTDIVAIDDVEAAAALQFIQEQAGRPIRTKDIVDHVHLSRRALELRFRRALGRTIHDELQRARLDRTRRLLLESDLPMPKVAEAAGYSTASYMGQVFHKAMGMTPAQYRRQVRGGESR